MEFNNRIKEKIKESLSLVDVIGKTVSLTNAGSGMYTGSVGKSGKSGASLRVDSKLQLWNDFKNNHGGDVFDWIGYEKGLDARGVEFPQVLRIASEMAGIKLPEMTDDDLNKVSEGAKLKDLLTEIANIYHKNITERPDLMALIKDKWGISAETVNRLKIGYATAGRDLKNIDNNEIKNTGLVYLNNGIVGGEVFKGRIMFPYWKGGKVVYFIGRETEETPQSEKERGMKYRKQPVHKEKFPYISDTIENGYFYGEDSLKGEEYCILTEGVTDCIVMIQAGFPCISPVTVQFREKDYPKLLELTRKLKTVYICNDNEENAAGLRGALKTAGILESSGIETRLIELPRPRGIDKIDLAEYMAGHSIDAFRDLMRDAVGLWDFKLSTQEIPEKTLAKKKAAERFILEDLEGMKFDDLKTFVMSDVREAFKLKAGDLRPILKNVQAKLLEIDKKTDPANFEEIAKVVLENYKLFVMEDTKEFYIYKSGRYYTDGAESEIRQAARDISKEINLRRGINDPEPLTDRAVREVLEYLKDYKFIHRKTVNNRKHTINFKNGLLDVDTWTFTGHDPEYFCTIQIPVNYEPEADCPTFDKYLTEVIDDEDAEVLYQFMGYSLIPDTRIQKAVMLIGKGSNGKSVFLKVFSKLLGSENIAGESLQNLEENRFSIAKLYGKLVNMFKDLPSTTLDKCEIFKTLTGDDGEIRGEEKFKPGFYFENTARLIFSANGLPKVLDDNFAFYRRWILINFPNVISEDAQDKKLYQKLTTEEELSGILNRALTGLKSVLKNERFSYSKTASEVERIYKINSRPVDAFIYERLQASVNDTPKAYILEEYSKWCKSNDVEPVHENKFAKIMKRLGYDTVRRTINKQKMSFYEGVAIKKDSDTYEDREDNDKDENGQGKEICLSPLPSSTDTDYFNLDKQNVISSTVGKSRKNIKNGGDIGVKNILFTYGNSVENASLPVRVEENDSSIHNECGHAKIAPLSTGKDCLSANPTDMLKSSIMRMDLNNFSKSNYNLVVADIDEFTNSFISKYPGYGNDPGRASVRYLADMLNHIGWR